MKKSESGRVASLIGVYGKRMLVENPTEEVVSAGDNTPADQGTEKR